MKRIFFCMGVSCILAACNPEDRSGEQPFAPTVRTLSATVEGRRCTLAGVVEASPNSDVLKCGFNYGNDTLRLEAVADDSADVFRAEVESLLPGDYFAVAYATNGVGTGRGDTLRFTVR